MAAAPKLNYRRPALIGLTALLLLLGGGIAWSHFANIAGAVIASGSVTVLGKPKSVQHLDGGIVKEIYIKPGKRVSEYQLLVLLDDTTIAANLAIYERRLLDAVVRRERLDAELNGRAEFAAPQRLIELLKLGNPAPAMAQQTALLNARYLTRNGQIAQLTEKVSQFMNQISGVTGLRVEKQKQIEAFREESEGVKTLVADNLAPKSRLLALDRSRADMRGQIAEHVAEVSRLQNSIAETKIAKLQVEREFRERALSELEKAESQIDELRQQLQATRKQLARVAIRAPVAGIVHELSLFTIGGIVQPGQTIMQIVPQTDEHEIEVNVDTQSIDQIYVGQKAVVRFPAFHQRVTPELDGKIAAVSPSSVVDEKTGLAFYRVTLEIDDDELSRLGGKSLIPGMPVEAFFPTSERSVLSYLVKPLSDHLRYALREE